ncbi:ATP-binding protein [Spirulina sp. CS-785/01]|uniref:PAS domain-containing sensor histidine kinase n=1 Tax=Spirulina sp. CS-785/01 TaxID=3021716 RepID=UPI00232D1CD1|nr:ATP-binding protein [Spirulina sp. CS-785/01]MDB9311646.1 ATP-binding protein [Spirulina sp. CS-785/01]
MDCSVSSRLFQPLLQYTPAAIAMFDRQMTHLLVSQQWLQDYGLTEDQIIGRSLPDTAQLYRISPSLLTRWQDTSPGCLRGKEHQDEGSHVFTASGEKEWVQWEMSPWKNEQGEIGGVIISSRFILPWKQQENLLQQTQARFLNLSANLPGMLFQFLRYEDGTIAYPFISSGCQDLFELSPPEIQEHPELIVNCIHPSDRESYDESISVSARLLTPFYWEGRILTPSGQTKWVEASSRPEKQPNQAVLWDGLVIDTTPRKIAEIALQQYQEHLTEIVQKRTQELTEANQQLQIEIKERETKTQQLEELLTTLQRTQAQLIQTEKMSSLGQLVAGVAHEINNPINFIYGNINYLQDYGQDLFSLIEVYDHCCDHNNLEVKATKRAIDLEFIQQDFPQILQSMKSGAERIQNIINSLKTFSHHNESDLKWADIHKGLDSTLMILSNRLKPNPYKPHIDIIKNYQEIPFIECYAGQLNQVFLCMLNNAIDAIEYDKRRDKKPNHIIITTQKINEEQIKITIEDTGEGIEEDLQNKLFDPFFTTKPVGVGTGLGLTICYQIIVEKHKGEILVESQPQEGSQFTIILPIRLPKM